MFSRMSLAVTNRVDLDRRDGLPLVTPIQIAQFQHEQRYQILQAYTEDGIILTRVFQGSTDSTVFEDFIEQLLPFISGSEMYKRLKAYSRVY